MTQRHLHARTIIALLVPLMALFGSGGSHAAAVGRDDAPSAVRPERESLIAYRMVDQWPERQQATTGLFQQPVDLDVSGDGRVFVADAGIGGIHTLQPSGTFAPPFGTTGGAPAQLGRVGPIAVGPDPTRVKDERLYVLDTGNDRVVIYGLDGAYVAEWPRVNATSIAASHDGRVYVLDRDTSRVRALDPATGAERFAFGERGTERGQFANFTDVSVSPDGRVLAVADMGGVRVQLFDMADDAELAGATPPAPARLRRVYDLLAARFNKGDSTCRASRVSALGDDEVFVGESTTACLVDNTEVSFAIAASAEGGTICRETVRMPSLHPDSTQYFAVAVHDPNSGKCGEKRRELPTSMVVVRYGDTELRSVRAVWQVASNDELEDPALYAPRRLSMPVPGTLFVEDSSSRLRFYSSAGDLLATVARDSSVTDAGTDTEFYRLTSADGSDVPGEVFASYVLVRRTSGNPEFETGVGRYRNVERQGPTGKVDVVEPIWTVTVASMGGTGRRIFAFNAVAFNGTSGELLMLMSDSAAQQRTVDMRIVRFTAAGTRLPESWDVPDDGSVNPYTDMTVGPDGRIYLLDDLADVVRILRPDGTPAGDVPVAYDARSVAGGPPSPDGSVFVMRAAGAIERHADDGTITARLDGRPLASSDPATLTDLVVGGDGRVYVSDAQASLISVFEPSGDATALPLPADGTCLFRAAKSAAPSRVDLGAAVTVSLGVEGLCAPREEPSDIVIVVPYYGELQQGRDPAAMMITQMLLLGAKIDYSLHRMGIVSYYQTSRTELELTHDRAAYDQAVRGVQRYTPPNQDVKPRLERGMATAARLFDDSAPGRRKVMLLLNPLYCDPDNERTPGACAGYVSASDTAAAIRASGVTIVVLGGFGGGGGQPGPGRPGGFPGGGGGNPAANLASSDEDILRGPEEAHRRLVFYHPPDATIASIGVTDEVPASMTVDASSIDAGGSWSTPYVKWAHTSVAAFAGSFRLVPTRSGRQATNVAASAEIVDGWGVAHTLTFPVPEIDVIGPPPTSSPPTAVATWTPVPTTPPTVEPTAGPDPSTVYLPLVSNRACRPGKDATLDVVLVLDHSNSMSGATLDQGRRAAAALLEVLLTTDGLDRFGLVTFAHEARVAAPLGADRQQVDAALAALQPAAGTRIDRGIEAGLELLAGSTAGRRAMVVLSDGGQTEDPSTARAAADRARSTGVTVVTVAVGDAVDGDLLAQLAVDPTGYFRAPEATSVHERLVAGLERCGR